MDLVSVPLLLIDLALIIVMAQGLGRLGIRLGQPQVIGEIVAGVLLGVLLAWSPGTANLMPFAVRDVLTALSVLGVAWFMFAVGLELDGAALRPRIRGVVVLVGWSGAVPWALGAALALLLAARHDSDHPIGNAVFFGLAMSITACPVLARILKDRDLISTGVGQLSMTLATVTDVLVWVVAALLLAVLNMQGALTVTLVVPYVALMLLLVGRVMRPHLRRKEATPESWVGVFGLCLALVSGAVTEAIGLHFIFGAFLAGALVGAHSTGSLRAGLRDRAEKLSSLLLPVYFVMVGLGINFGSMGPGDLAEGVLILLVAVVGKVGGTYLGARQLGMPSQEGGVLAVLMNTKGLTELLLLDVGLRAGLIDQSLYAVLVCVAVLTTVMTGPLVTWLLRDREGNGRPRSAGLRLVDAVPQG